MARPRKKNFSKSETTNLAERITQLRKARGLSQIELAAKLGISQANVSQFERGERWPHVKHVIKMALLLRTSADELLGLMRTRDNGQAASRSVVRRLRRIEDLPRRDRQALLRMIDNTLVAAATSRRAA